MFRNAKVGDRVWDFINLWGTIAEINEDETYCLIVEFDNGISFGYTIEGKFWKNDTRPTLFWDEIKFEIPKKSLDLEAELRKLKVKKFVPGEHNYYIGLGHGSELVHFYNSLHIEFPELTYFDGDNLPEVVENINEHGITKEEFFKAYDNVFKKKGDNYDN